VEFLRLVSVCKVQNTEFAVLFFCSPVVLHVPDSTRDRTTLHQICYADGWSSVSKFCGASSFLSRSSSVVVFLWNPVNFVGFSVIHVSQGSVATYVKCGGMST